MRRFTIRAGEYALPAIRLHTAVIGSGCAGLNAAARLHAGGVTDTAIITDSISAGTSRNAGSDKQTYYKLTLAGDLPDSVRAMADTYLQYGAMDGDTALCEAALSAKCFLRLCELGVPFPTNRYGEYVGYKTDHDPAQRATSAGPLTSKLMSEALERDVRARGVAVLDGLLAVALLTRDGHVAGVLCLNAARSVDDGAALDERFTCVLCQNVILATGGPAAIYLDSCFPVSQHGMSGMAYLAGARGQSLSEWQYGLASIAPRWNVSGTYMQALPRFVSTDADGNDPREFLSDYIPANDVLTLTFLKGYQWPFDSRKAGGGSSLVDMAVQRETKEKGRRVFLDYTANPFGRGIDMNALSDEARAYLIGAGIDDALAMDTPFARLMHMNSPAVDFYRGHGIDLATDRLEIALCAQHNNGGVAVDHWWQTDVQGLFAVGEAAGTHGMYRPGGSALNAGQVGSTRAAAFIMAHVNETSDRLDANADSECTSINDDIARQVSTTIGIAQAALGDASNIDRLTLDAQRDMSRYAAAIRDASAIPALVETVREKLADFAKLAHIMGADELPALYRYRDLLVTQLMCLSAMADCAVNGISSGSGGAIYVNLPDNASVPSTPGSRIQNARLNGLNAELTWREPRPIPALGDVFENVWRGYRENGNVY